MTNPTELEMHRADYQACKAAGFESPGELLAVYKALLAKPELSIWRVYLLKPLGPRERKHTVYCYRVGATDIDAAMSKVRAYCDDPIRADWQIISASRFGPCDSVVFDGTYTQTKEQAQVSLEHFQASERVRLSGAPTLAQLMQTLKDPT